MHHRHWQWPCAFFRQMKQMYEPLSLCFPLLSPAFLSKPRSTGTVVALPLCVVCVCVAAFSDPQCGQDIMRPRSMWWHLARWPPPSISFLYVYNLSCHPGCPYCNFTMLRVLPSSVVPPHFLPIKRFFGEVFLIQIKRMLCAEQIVKPLKANL